ncbi:MAG: YkvA family protein [Haloferacaceae archaeon]
MTRGTGGTERGRLARLRDRLDRLRREVRALGLALRDPRTPRRARLVLGLTVGLAASPIDPIPDFVPVLGYVDDLLLVPAGVWLSRRLTPDEVLAEARSRARDRSGSTVGVGWLVAGLVVAGYAAATALAALLLARHV